MLKQIISEILEEEDIKNKLISIILDSEEVKSEIEKIINKETKKEKKSDTLLEENKNLKNELVKLELSNKQLKEEINNLNSQHNDLSTYISNLKAENDILKSDIDIRHQKIKECEDREKEHNKLILDLKSELEHKSMSNTILENENKKLQEEKIAITSILEKCKNDIETKKSKILYYEKSYGEIDSIYKRYKSMDEDMQNKLVSIINADSVKLFFISSMQWSNIEALWEIIRLDFNKYTLQQLEILTDTLDFMFDNYASYSNDYERLDAIVGEKYDDDYHTRMGDSLVNGYIEKVLLKGYINKKNPKKSKKSLVKVSATKIL